MSQFEFLAVFVSIVIGLGVTHILHSVGRIIHNRDRVEVDAVHAIWTLTTLLTLILNWWVFFYWSDFTAWSLDVYLVLIAWATTLYLIAVILYPPDIGGDASYAGLFERNRVWFLGTMIAFVVLDIAQTTLRGDIHDPPEYLAFEVHLAVAAALGIQFGNRRFQLALGSYVFVAIVAWALGVRRFLSG